MTFDDSYIKDISKLITKREFEIPNEIGFCNYENREQNFIYTFLSCKNRRTWLHHFGGTYGTIIINELENSLDMTNNKEIENILNSQILQKRPLLLLFDKNKIWYKGNEKIESLRYMLDQKKIKYNIQDIDFKVNYYNSELLYGLDWLEREIRKKQ